MPAIWDDSSAKAVSTDSPAATPAAAPDLVACVVFLEAEADTVVPASQGQYAHAAFLNLVREADPSLAALLHDGQGRKPFTVSLLGGLGEGREDLVPLRAGGRCWLRFTLLEPALFRAFRATLVTRGQELRVRIGPGVFRVLGVAGTTGSHPWAGAARAADLAALQPARELTLQFAAPTAWSAGGDGVRRMEVFPVPGLVFGGLASAWNAWCGGVCGRMGPDVRAYAEASAVVSHMRLATRALQFGGRPQIGMVGTVTYTLLRDEAGMARRLRTLAEFAFYAGVGYRTAMGMGQVRCLRGRGSG